MERNVGPERTENAPRCLGRVFSFLTLCVGSNYYKSRIRMMMIRISPPSPIPIRTITPSFSARLNVHVLAYGQLPATSMCPGLCARYTAGGDFFSWPSSTANTHRKVTFPPRFARKTGQIHTHRTLQRLPSRLACVCIHSASERGRESNGRPATSRCDCTGSRRPRRWPRQPRRQHQRQPPGPPQQSVHRQ